MHQLLNLCGAQEAKPTVNPLAFEMQRTIAHSNTHRPTIYRSKIKSEAVLNWPILVPANFFLSKINFF